MVVPAGRPVAGGPCLRFLLPFFANTLHGPCWEHTRNWEHTRCWEHTRNWEHGRCREHSRQTRRSEASNPGVGEFVGSEPLPEYRVVAVHIDCRVGYLRII